MFESDYETTTLCVSHCLMIDAFLLTKETSELRLHTNHHHPNPDMLLRLEVAVSATRTAQNGGASRDRTIFPGLRRAIPRHTSGTCCKKAEVVTVIWTSPSEDGARRFYGNIKMVFSIHVRCSVLDSLKFRPIFWVLLAH